jgi:FAD/FMN-containing dehydrogenase
MKTKILAKPWHRIALAAFLLPLFAILLTTVTILYMGHSRDIHTWRPPQGLHGDASHLDATHIAHEVQLSSVPETAILQLRQALQEARSQHLKISVAGARHSMGGQTVYPDGIVVDMLQCNSMQLDSTRNANGALVLLHVQAGARWSDVIPYLDAHGYAVRIMQSNNPFTVGGTLSVNAHGWQHNEPPFASSVESFQLFTADGESKTCSRSENTDLFHGAIGGYGLFGVLVSIDLRVMPNALYRAERFELPAEAYSQRYHALVDNNPTLGLVYGRLSVAPRSFLKQALLTRYTVQPGTVPVLSLQKNESTGLMHVKHLLFLASVGSGFGKEFRWFLEKTVGGESAALATRNRILNDPIDLFENHDSTRTQLLHEYFVPRDSLESFLVQARSIIPGHAGDLLNLTVRSLAPDSDAYLHYARENVFSLVMLFSQATTAPADSAMAAMTRDLIDAALAVGGTYYLPYRRHATRNQFFRAYPMAEGFFALKRQYDPEELFQNQFYREYGIAQL